MASKKRPAAVAGCTAAGHHVQKRRLHVSTQVQGKCNGIIAVVADAPVPKSVSNMLASVLGASLTLPKDERHRYHVEVIDMVAEILTGRTVYLQSNADEAHATLLKCQTEKSSRDSAASEISKELVTLQKVASARKVDAAEHQLMDQAKEQLDSCLRSQKEGDSALESTAATKIALGTVFKDSLELYKTTAVEENSDTVKLLQNLGNDGKLDASLLKCFLCVIVKPPEQRGQFDMVVLGQVEAERSQATARLADAVAAGDGPKRDRAEAVAVAKKNLDEANAKLQTLKQAINEDLAAETASKQRLSAAHQEVGRYLAIWRKAEDAVRIADEELAAFRKGTLGTFEELRESGMKFGNFGA